MMLIAFEAFVAAALYYLFAKAVVTEWLWSWYEDRFPRFGEFMSCAACTGFWYGLLLHVGAQGVFELSLLADPVSEFYIVQVFAEAILVGLFTMVSTPLLAAAHDRALRYLGGEDS